ncbi:MAG: biotin/lipoyl-containing protein [Dysgonamonadaceae bacterium]|jgi:biotin carboxyl carrier protein|nr:MAG: Glutaconyl-CoA decarboxylase subunit gamma [Bacteroidetes bacterium ADurb.Bin234]
MKEYRININGTNYNVSIEEVETSNGNSPRVAEPVKTTTAPTPIEKPQSAPVEKKTAPAPTAGGSDYVIKSPLPGIVLDILVREGDTVKAGQKVILLEAMKMENNIESDKDGVVKSINVTKGDGIYEGDTLVILSC